MNVAVRENCVTSVKRLVKKNYPFEHSPSPGDQLGGRMDAGFRLIGLVDDRHYGTAISEHTPTYVATRAFKP